MHMALLGATGAVGSRILAELERRGHSVTAISRSPGNIRPTVHVAPLAVDVHDEAALVKAIAGHDAVISAVGFLESNPQVLIRAMQSARVPRYVIGGGAGSLDVASGVRLYDTTQFPDEWKPEARAGGAFLDLLRDTDDLEWTMLSPSALLLPGERTGKFRLGHDQLLVDGAGKSSISLEDYAVALVDEVERPAHLRRRFTVGY